MFFGCCCKSSVNNYWVRKFADEYPCNVLSEVDVEKFRDTGNDSMDYPQPRDVVGSGDTIVVVSTDPSNGWGWTPTTWMRHIYDLDLELIRADKWNTPYAMHHTNGTRTAFGNATARTIDVFDSSAQLVCSVSVGASDFLTAVCMDAANNIYGATYQTSGGFRLVFVTKWNATGSFQWKTTLEGSFSAMTVGEMEYADDGAVWALSGNYQQSDLRRLQAGGGFSGVSGPFGATSSGGTYHPLLRAAANKMWRIDTSTTLWQLRRYSTTPTQDTVWGTGLSGPGLNATCANGDTAVWVSNPYQVVKYTGSVQQYNWSTASPWGYAGGFNVCWENGFGPLGMAFHSNHVYG
ncbi:MAG: hypothetical protein ACK6D3_24240, partial [Planctomycetaceae bacterium]